MKRIWLFRTVIFLLIILFCFFALKHPLYKPLDLSAYEGKEYYLNNFIIGKKLESNVYEVHTKYVNQSAIVKTDSNFQEGQEVSFSGYVNEGKLMVQRYHIHDYPNFPIYSSFLSLPLLLLVFIREWRENRRFS